MKTLILFIIIFIFHTNYINACSCAPPGNLVETRKEHFNSSDIVLIGDVIYISENYNEYHVLVREIFKGVIKVGDTLKFAHITNCEPVVDTMEEWLLYANIIDNFYEIIPCGISRSINNPEKNRYFNIIPPPPPNSKISSPEWDKIVLDKEEKNRTTARRELELEINELREKQK